MNPAPFAFVLYARVPRRGEVKTRLTPWLDRDEALALHVAMLEDSLRLLRAAAKRAGAVPYVAFSEAWEPPASAPWENLARVAGATRRLPQRGPDLGARLIRTCDALLDRRHGGVVIIGSDSPSLPPDYPRQAQAALQDGADLAIGPAEDGGFYLVGLRRPSPELFEGIPWGTGRVCGAIREAATRLGLRSAQLPPWYDIDRPADLTRLHGGRDAERARCTAAFAASLARAGRLPEPA